MEDVDDTDLQLVLGERLEYSPDSLLTPFFRVEASNVAHGWRPEMFGKAVWMGFLVSCRWIRGSHEAVSLPSAFLNI